MTKWLLVAAFILVSMISSAAVNPKRCYVPILGCIYWIPHRTAILGVAASCLNPFWIHFPFNCSWNTFPVPYGITVKVLNSVVRCTSQMVKHFGTSLSGSICSEDQTYKGRAIPLQRCHLDDGILGVFILGVFIAKFYWFLLRYLDRLLRGFNTAP